MATIGTFTKTSSGFTGTIQTIGLKARQSTSASTNKQPEKPPWRGAERAHDGEVVAALLERGVKRDEDREPCSDDQDHGERTQRLDAYADNAK